MKIGVVTPGSPSGVVGGAERLWSSLAARLRARGHDVEVITIPFAENDLADILEGYRAFGELDVARFDVVITGKYPAWMINHPRHLVYLLHPLRGLYDTYPADLPVLTATPEGPGLSKRLDECTDPVALLDLADQLLVELGPTHHLCRLPGPLTRDIVRRLDAMAFVSHRVRRFAAISEEVAGRDDYLPPDRPVLIAHPETDLVVSGVEPSPQATFVAISRLDRPKRIDLAIAGFRDHLHDAHARLVIVGDGPDRTRLEGLAAGDDRISFEGAVSDTALADWYATATAVIFVPFAEDFGYVSLEAMLSGTPVISTTDAGGAKELIEHGVDGLIMDPDPRSLAWGMSHISSSTFTRWQMGLNARRTAASVNWDVLLDEIDDLRNDDPRPNVLVLSTYPVFPAVGGGQRRIFQLDQALTKRAEVTVLVLSSRTMSDRRRRLGPGLVQIEIARSADQIQAEEAIYDVMGMPVDDLTAAALAEATPNFGRELHRLLPESDLVVLSQPFLAPTLPDHLEIPVVHDSQNAEFRMKADLLPSTEAGEWLLSLGVAAETRATAMSSLLVAWTEADLDDIKSLASRSATTSAGNGRTEDGEIPGIVVPNGVDAAAMPERTKADIPPARSEILAISGASPDDRRHLAVFIGSWHPPNIEAARLILGLAERRRDWIFILAGSHTSEFASVPQPDNVHLIPIFSEGLLWPLLAGADVALNPMVSGGGSNLKLFDYLAVGTPILATPVGARGLENAAKHVTLSGPDLDSLSAGLDAVLSLEPTQRAARQAAGRRLIETTYDWSVLGTIWSNALLKLVDAAPTEVREVRRISKRPILTKRLPPNIDPVLAAMDVLESLATTQPPPPADTIMNPRNRERIQQANANRHMGRVLPQDARYRIPKKLLIRLGQALSNEQVVFNEATLDILEQLSQQIDRLTTSNDALRKRIIELEDRLPSIKDGST
jgi:glycosyltransferase involved in cell wall biosynthesis